LYVSNDYKFNFSMK